MLERNVLVTWVDGQWVPVAGIAIGPSLRLAESALDAVWADESVLSEYQDKFPGQCFSITQMVIDIGAYERAHECRSGHHWVAGIVLSDFNVNLSGERVASCPVCHEKPLESSAPRLKQ
jgi:hypothetical protein